MMKKINVFPLIVLLALGSQAAVRNEWTFQNDSKGTLLTNAANSGLDGSAFEAGGAGVLEADGLGALLSTPSAPTLWGEGGGKGATLDADITDTNTLFLRYDLDYDLSSGRNTVGTSIGLSFVDSTGTNISGLVFAYGVVSAPDGETLTPVISTLPLTGTLSAIAEVGPNNISVWYSTNGVDFVVGVTNVTVSITSIADLRIQATGTASPSGSGDFVAVENIRVADTWASIAGIVQPSVKSKYLNEWLFDRDPAGRTLSEAINSGTDRDVFSVDTARITQTDGLRSLICRNDVADTGNLWTNGAVLKASVKKQTSGVCFLRYDLDYDMTATNKNTGTLLGLAFSDGTGANLAGVVLKADGGSPNDAPPPGIAYTPIAADIGTNGSLSVIAKVDLDAQAIEVWYDLTGSNSFNASNAPNGVVSNLNLTTISQLEFRATGDFIASASNECVVIDNILTAASWAEIIEPPANLLSPPELTVSVNGSGVMVVGQTNTISVTIHNSGRAAANVSSTLVHDGGAGLSIISSNNAATPIAAGGSAVQTYLVVANPSADGSYILTAQATMEGANSGAPATFVLYVGARISYDSYVVTNETGVVNAFPGVAEPGETFDLIITSVNDGGVPVSGITNRLTAANPLYFPSVSSINGNTYALLNKGAATSTTYRVTCSTNTPNGLQAFTVINSTAGKAWTNQFQLNVRWGANLAVAPAALTLNVFAGEMNSGSVTLTNAGNAATDYTVVFPTPFPGSIYAATETNAEGLYSFPPGTNINVFTSWNGTQTKELDIGFSFAPFGVAYTRFSVSQTGTVWLKNAGGDTATLKPFETTTLSAQSTIRYKKIGGLLILAWGNGTGQEFQAWINANGTVLYLYESGTWGIGTIGAMTAGNTQTFSHTPGLTGRDGLLLTAAQWVSASGGTIGAQTSQPLKFTADAREIRRSASTVLSFAATIYGGSTPQTVTVTVNVSATAAPGITISPSPLSFSGPAGFITHTNMTLTNTGNFALNYILTDSGLETAGYTMQKVSPFPWNSVPPTSEYILTAATLDTQPIAIGFPFTFFGSVYTNLTVGLNGTLTLGSTQVIVPFSASLTTNNYSSIRAKTNDEKTEFTVTWAGMLQPGGGNGQTFQAVLYHDTGVIRFNYDQLTGNWPNGAIYLNASGSVTGTLSNNETTVTSQVITPAVYTNDAIGRVTLVSPAKTNTVVSYAADANRQSIQFIPGKQQIISATPRSGTIPVGSAVLIDVVGNAKTLEAGGASSVTNGTTFTVFAESSQPLEQTLVSSSDDFAWTRSGGNNNEWYLTSAGGGNPQILKPTDVYINGAYREKVSPGGLTAAHTWGWGDNDSLGFPTIYVRLADVTWDPDALPANYVRKKPYSVTKSANVNFTATNSAVGTYPPVTQAMAAAMWGAEDPVVSSQQNANGSHTLWWPAATTDIWSRTYVVWCTTSLSGTWHDIATLKNSTTYVDDDPVRNTEPVIFYKVTVQ